MARPQIKRWQIYRMHKGVVVQVGQVAAANHPQALRNASQKWSVYADKFKPGFGFTARPANREPVRNTYMLLGEPQPQDDVHELEQHNLRYGKLPPA